MNLKEANDFLASDLQARADLFLRENYPEVDGVRIVQSEAIPGKQAFSIQLRNSESLDPALVSQISTEMVAWLQADYEEALTPPSFWQRLKALFRP